MNGILGRRVLIVGAHADDIEIACGGTAARLLSEGAEVTALVVTDTHYVRNGIVHRDSAQAQKEAEAAAKTIGYPIYFGTARNNDVKVTSELVYFIRGHIERCNAGTIITHWDGDAHLDHRAIASATMMALACYGAELNRNGEASFDWIRHANRVTGATAGKGYAEEFQIVKYYL